MALALIAFMEFRMRQSPSIIPTDRLDWDTYLVLEDFRQGAAWRKTDEPADLQTLVGDLLTRQYGQPLRVVAFGPAEGWSRDTSQEVAQELPQRRAGGHAAVRRAPTPGPPDHQPVRRARRVVPRPLHVGSETAQEIPRLAGWLHRVSQFIRLKPPRG
jgi:hypothetical protein